MDTAFKHRFKRKTRKLFNSPGAFIADMARNRAEQIQERYWQYRGYPARRRYTIISAVYGVERYLDDFFNSLEAQTVDIEECLEIIMVDDGSIDGSAEIIRRWQRRYPGTIRYLRKENGGQASARNTGIPYATGDWVTFIDPDDFVDSRYFEFIDRFLDANAEHDMAAVSCNFIVYDEALDRKRDAHPLRFRFTRGNRTLDIEDLFNEVQLASTSICFRRDLLEQLNLRFDERIRPSFEDAHFVNRFLFANAHRRIGFLKDARYYYRKRGDKSSTLDRSWEHPGLFSDVLEFGCLDLLKKTSPPDGDGYAPRWIQNAVLYHLFWYFARLVPDPNTVSHLNESQRIRFVELVQEILQRIDPSTIKTFSLGGAWLFHKIGMLALRGEGSMEHQHVYLTDFDRSKRLIKLRYFYTDDEPIHSFFVDQKEVFPLYSRKIHHRFIDRTFVTERVMWVHIPIGSKLLSGEVQSRHLRFVTCGRIQPSEVKLDESIETLERVGRNIDALPLTARAELALARAKKITERYRNAFLFMDRDTQADDNAEHLYRYTIRTHPNINAFFVLNRDSHDWDRLKEEGFRLLAFGGLEHRLALLNARHLISSHIDHYVVSHPRASLTPFMNAKISFLQHGVTKDDLSSWLNTKNIAFLATVSQPEFDAFISERFGYKFTEREVVLSGFPRHDRLLASPAEMKKQLLIMPTWRQSLAGKTLGSGNARAENPAFYESEFASRWKALLHSDALEELANRYNYDVVFFPHANLAIYIDWFDAPSFIRVKRHNPNESIQKLFQEASILITDYSSVAFEMAYLKKPVLYYQFDRDEVFGGKHIYRPGYFDYERDGFGPVLQTLDALLGELERAMDPARGIEDRYLERMEAWFAFRDGKCCERSLRAILALEEPLDPKAEAERQEAELVRAAIAASANQAWPIAERRWRAVLKLPERIRPKVAKYRLIEALRHQGKPDEIAALLTVTPSGEDEEDAELSALHHFESAALAAELGQWEQAIEGLSPLLESPDLPDAMRDHAVLLFARSHREAGRFDEAAAALELYAATTSGSFALHAERAELAAGQHDWTAAAREWEKAIAYEPAPRAMIAFADALLRSGRTDDALQLLNSDILNADDPELRRSARRLRALATAPAMGRAPRVAQRSARGAS